MMRGHGRLMTVLVAVVLGAAPNVRAQVPDVAAHVHDAAERGDPIAQLALGFLYAMGGDGVRQDVATAVAWWRRAADGRLRLPAAAAEYDDGAYVADRVRHMRAMAEEDAPDSQVGLGWHYLTGDGVPQDDVEAVAWFRRAADQGHETAYFMLGFLHAVGWGVPQDDASAFAWLSLVAERTAALCDSQECAIDSHVRRLQLFDEFAAGMDAAQLAEVRQRVDTQRRIAETRRHAENQRFAARLGIASAQRELGRLYFEGRGVQQDIVAAYVWLARAAAQGDEDARRLRDQVAARMSDSQFAEAHRLAP